MNRFNHVTPGEGGTDADRANPFHRALEMKFAATSRPARGEQVDASAGHTRRHHGDDPQPYYIDERGSVHVLF